jgi:hypothetical protein
MAMHGIDYSRVVRSGYRSYTAVDTFFDGELHQAHLPGVRLLDWETFIGHAKSLSVTPQPDHPGYNAFERAMRLYFETHSRDGVLTMPTICWITAARFRTQ